MIRRGLAAALLTLLLGLSGVACPSRDLGVQITDDGVGTVVLACESFGNACAGLACARNRFLCDQVTCKLRNACELPGNPEWEPTKVMGVQLLLTVATPEGMTLKRKSKCHPLNLRPCVHDPAGLVGCPGAPADSTACVTRATAAVIADALGQNGLTFDGFDSTDEVLLTVAIFQKRSGESSCDDSASLTLSEDDCAVDTLVAAAGLAAPLGASVYDITCASCQGGPHGSLGRDNGACPASGEGCFLVRTAKLLAGE